MKATVLVVLVALSSFGLYAATVDNSASVPAAATPASAFEPQARERAFDPELLRTGDLIRYRTLSREDFRARVPPPEAQGLHGQLGAATCVFLTTSPGMTIRASSRGVDQELGQFRGEVENLGFMAFMDRECSWWNPEPIALEASYILQHEQIHFAIFEIAATELNRQAAQMTQRFVRVSTSQEAVIEEIRALLDLEIRRAMDEIMARSNAFDRETSRAYRPLRQEEWWESINGELTRLRGAGWRP